MATSGQVLFALTAFFVCQLTGAQTVTEQQAAALKVIRETAESMCVTPPLDHTGQNATLTVSAKAEVNNLIKKIADVGAAASGTVVTSNSKGVLEKDLANAIEQSDDCKLAVLKLLVDKMVPALGSQPPSAIEPVSSIDKIKTINGYFEKNGDRWVEYPPYAPGSNFMFKEARRDADYIYLYDPSRTKNGDEHNPMMLRLPTHGGAVQWSYTNPVVWTDLTLALSPGK